MDSILIWETMPCDFCKKGKCDIIGKNEPFLDPEDDFYQYTLNRKCRECGKVDTGVYYSEQTQKYFDSSRERIEEMWKNCVAYHRKTWDKDAGDIEEYLIHKRKEYDGFHAALDIEEAQWIAEGHKRE